MRFENVRLSTGDTKIVLAIPMEQHLRIMKRLGGILSKQEFPGLTSFREVLREAVRRMDPDLIEHCGVAVAGMSVEDGALILAAARRVNAVDNLFDPAEFGTLAINVRAYEQTLLQLAAAS